MATELESVLPVLKGMEKGYALSPMADLEREYTSSSDKETSLFQRATMIASSKGLASSSVMDRGLSSRGRVVARFSLEMGFLILTEKTVKDMDTLLRNTVRLLPQRNSHFIVDPNTTFLSVLKSVGDLNDFDGTRDLLRLPERQDSSDVNYLYDHVPNLRKLWPPHYNPHADSVEHAVKVPSQLLDDFPDRQVEDLPVTFYYTSDGARVEIPASMNSSYGVGPEFQPPWTDSPGPTRRGCPRARSESPAHERIKSLSPRRRETQRNETLGAAQGASAVPTSIPSFTGFVGNEIQFKRPEDTMLPLSPRDSTYTTATPGPGLPDPLRGMATAAPFRISRRLGEEPEVEILNALTREIGVTQSIRPLSLEKELLWRALRFRPDTRSSKEAERGDGGDGEPPDSDGEGGGRDGPRRPPPRRRTASFPPR
ncbi:hypothetical protein B0H14DRAFT_3491805 [Mycena olivaceomarginata]|nr:hypothetical protein B0H14DRAFT_3491805 [Mycena olivaceomarginata]